MNTKELMVGDWILYDGKPARVNCVASSSVGLEGVESDTICKDDMIEPIPITSEILEKNGFEWNTYHTSQDLVCGTIHLGYGFYKNCISASDWDENGNVQIVSLKCEYVHELQHVLRLCGIDKEIELWHN